MLADMSQSIRHALQGVIVHRAGSEVASMGPMHDKHAESSKIVQAHMAPVFEELVALSVKIGVPRAERYLQ